MLPTPAAMLSMHRRHPPQTAAVVQNGTVAVKGGGGDCLGDYTIVVSYIVAVHGLGLRIDYLRG